MSDKSSLPLAHMDWLDLASATRKYWKQRGHKVVRVPISLGLFRDFCRHRGYDHDSVARSRYARLNARPPRKVRKLFSPWNLSTTSFRNSRSTTLISTFARFAKSHTLTLPVRNVATLPTMI